MPRTISLLWLSAIVAFWLWVFDVIGLEITGVFLIWAGISEMTSIAWARQNVAWLQKVERERCSK